LRRFVVLCLGSASVFIQLSPYGVDAAAVLIPAAIFAAVMTSLNSAFGLYRREARDDLRANGWPHPACACCRNAGRLPVVRGSAHGTSLQPVLGYALLYAFCGMVLVRQSVQVVSRLGVGASAF